MKTTEDIIKDSLLQQSHSEFEQILKNAANLKQVLADESKESTSTIIMQLLGKKEKKPVSYDEEMDFIDAGAEEVTVPTHRRGNPEHHPREHHLAEKYHQDDLMETGTYRQRNLKGDEDEQIANTQRCDTLRPNERILGPASGGMFTSLSVDPIGSDLLQRNQLNAPNYALMTQKAPELGTLGDKKEEKPVTETKQQQRKGKKKKEKGLENEYTVKANEFSQRSLSEILLELGETVSVEPKGAAGKNKNKKKTGAETKEQNKNNNKKKNQGTSSSIAKMESNSEEEIANLTSNNAAAAAPVQTKRSSSGVAGSWEDAEEEFMSADEDIGGSNSRLTTPPTEFVDARSHHHRDEGLNDVMLDPSNYRDDEEVELLAKQLKDQEDEFITVGKNNKKNKQQQQKMTGANNAGRSGSDERGAAARNSPQNGHNRRFSATNAAAAGASATGSSDNKRQQNVAGNNRPVVQSTTLADYIDVSKKETHKNVKYHGKKPASFNNVRQSEESVGFVDALESSSPINVNTNPPTSGFSYADAAKKSSSGENSPQNEMRSPIAAAAQSSSISSSASSPPNVQVPPGYAQNDAANVSFGYIEPGQMKEEQEQEHETTTTSGVDGNDFVLKFGSRVVRFAKGHADCSQTERKVDPQTNALVRNLQETWNTFMSGKQPVVYQSKAQASSA